MTCLREHVDQTGWASQGWRDIDASNGQLAIIIYGGITVAHEETYGALGTLGTAVSWAASSSDAPWSFSQGLETKTVRNGVLEMFRR